METVDKIVTIGHTKSSDTPVRTVVSKTTSRIWYKRVRMEYPQMEKRKLKKINMRNVFKITLDKNIRPLWTNKQVDWMEKRIDVKGLFSYNLKTTSRISDFRRKFLMSYWGKPCNKCHLCGEEYDRMHIFTECKVVEKWENEIYGDASGKKQIVTTPINRELRMKAMMNPKSIFHTFSWIYNWCIWKNFWQIKFKDFDKSDQLDCQTQNLRKLLRFNEYLHLRYSLETVNENKLKKLENQTKLFLFFSLDTKS